MTRVANSRAVLVAATVGVHCPECDEPQPSPDNGSDFWLVEQVKEKDGQKLTCTSCDKSFVIHFLNRVNT